MKGEDLVKLEAISEDVFQQSQKRQRGMVSSALPASVGSRLGRLSFRPGDGENNVKTDRSVYDNRDNVSESAPSLSPFPQYNHPMYTGVSVIVTQADIV